jgi:hypothetical protein
VLGELFLPEPFAIKGKVGIPVSHGYVCMADHLLDVFKSGARKQEVGTKRVTQIMEVKVRDAGYPAGILPGFVEPFYSLAVQPSKDIA